MHEFGDSHDRYTDFDLALSYLHLFENFANGVASAFGGDNYA